MQEKETQKEQKPKCLGQLKRECSNCKFYMECLEISMGISIKLEVRNTEYLENRI